MIVCSNCRAKQLDGTIFCAECGASLIDAGPFEPTRQLGLNSAEYETPDDADQHVASDTDVGPRVTLVIVSNRRAIAVDLSDEALVGRADSNRGIVPDVDLGSFGGYDAGVSRRHAILSYRDGAYTVEDLGSANGTFVNGRQIEPSTVVSLHHGDELMFGTLLLRVELRGRKQ